MTERREVRRRRLARHLSIYDQATQYYLGVAADITTKGLLLITEQPIAVDTSLELRIDLPQSVFGCDHIDVTGKAVWRRKDAKPGVYVVGFAFVSISPRDAAIINQVISAYALVE